MKSVSLTNVGLVRETNQDSIINLRDSKEDYFLAVADGMGGHKAGDVASGIAARALTLFFENCDKSDVLSNREKITGEIKLINDAILAKSREDESCEGMGTTLTLCVTDGRKAVFYQVGDSRGYILGRNGFRQVTKDQSLVQFMVDTKQITNEQAKDHPSRHVILSALGTENEYDMDIYEEDIQEGDIILLCSDGLCDYVHDENMESLITESADIKAAAASLVNAANAAGGGDNISVILFEA